MPHTVAVSSNDVERAPGLIEHLTETVFWSIWWEVAMFSGIAAIVTAVDIKTSLTLAIPSTMLTVLGTVLGLTITFRVNSSYDRYWEGRKLWSATTVTARTLARLFWFHVPDKISASRTFEDKKEWSAEERAERKKEWVMEGEREKVKALIEKKCMVNLIEGYAVALKHYLRGEEGVFYEDLYPLVCFLPQYCLPSGRTDFLPGRGEGEDSALTTLSGLVSELPMNRLPSASPSTTFRRREPSPEADGITSENASKDSSRRIPQTFQYHGPLHPQQELLPSSNPPQFSILNDVFPFILPLYRFWRRVTLQAVPDARKKALKRKKKFKSERTGQNIPLEITLVFSSYISKLQSRKLLDAPTLTAMFNSLAQLSDSLTGLERILSTPIPFSYSLHLRHTVWLYLIFLPFQLQPTFKWVAIPAVSVAAFVFLGFLQIGSEIEDPFGYDRSDLKLDVICRNIIAKELDEITSHPPPDVDAFLFLDANLPLGKADGRTAAELLDVSFPDLVKGLYGANRHHGSRQASRNGSRKNSQAFTDAAFRVEKEMV